METDDTIQETESTVDIGVQTPRVISTEDIQDVELPEIKYATVSDRITDMIKQPDFKKPDVSTIDEVARSFNMPISKEIAHEMVDKADLSASIGEQSSVALENFLVNLGGVGDRAELAWGGLENWISGGTVGNELTEAAYTSMRQRLEDMGYTEESIGGIKNFIAKLVSGGASMTEFMLASLATGGVGGLAQMGVESLGEGVYNDMKAYADEHDGDLTGYVPKDKNMLLNVGNAMLQTAIERKIGLGSPRFLHGASRGFWKEGLSGFSQEFLQSGLNDVNEWLKGNIEWQDVVEGAHQDIEDGIIGGLLQGGLGSVTHYNYRKRATDKISHTIAKANGRENPNKSDIEKAEQYVNNVENAEVSALTTEIVDKVDEQTAGDRTQEQVDKTIRSVGRAINEVGGTTAIESDGVITVNTPNAKTGEIETEIYVPQEEVSKSEFFTPDSEFKVESGKKSASKVQKTLKKQFGSKMNVNVDKLEKMSIKDTVAKANKKLESDKQSVVNLLNDKNANKLDRATAYHALAQHITDENDIDTLRTLSDPEVAKFGRELGQAVAMLDIRDDTGFNVIEVAREVRNAKGEMTEQQFNDEVAKMGIEDVKLSEANVKELKESTECEL